MFDISGHFPGPSSADYESQVSGGTDSVRFRSVECPPRRSEESFVFSPPNLAPHGRVRPLPRNPPSAETDRMNSQQAWSLTLECCEFPLPGLIQAAFSAILLPHLIHFCSDLQADPPAIAQSAGGEDRGGCRRSTPPSSTVMSEMLRASALNYSDDTVSPGQTASQLAGPDPVPLGPAPPPGLSQLAGQSRSLPSPGIFRYQPSFRAGAACG